MRSAMSTPRTSAAPILDQSSRAQTCCSQICSRQCSNITLLPRLAASTSGVIFSALSRYHSIPTSYSTPCHVTPIPRSTSTSYNMSCHAQLQPTHAMPRHVMHCHVTNPQPARLCHAMRCPPKCGKCAPKLLAFETCGRDGGRADRG